MRVPLDWLAEWVDLPPSPQTLAERLTLAGLEVDGIERMGPDFSSLRVGLVVESGPHPNADRLTLCRVDVGERDPIDIVCGAPNVAAGQKVAVATPGSSLPDGTRIKKSKIRSVVSHGMICSPFELGLSEDRDGILVLDPDARVGAPLEQALPAGQVVMDVDLSPNRGDCASMLGIAREVRAQFGGGLREPECEPPEAPGPAADDVSVEIEDADGCYRYVARVVRGVKSRRTPDWLVRKLEGAGVRSRNLVVDVTNLVLLEFGQPLHAFDLATIRGGEIRVRAAREGEKLVSLDGQTRELVAEDLVIADAERAIALAGVIGGAETEVREGTSDLVIESAHFHPTRVRRTARRLGLQTEASYRFERGVDAAGIRRAADRCARLIAELGGGRVSAGVVEARGSEFAHADVVALDPAHPGRLLGTGLSAEEITALLARVEIRAERSAPDELRCRIPSYRNDLSIPEDLIEEVARIYGYDRIEATMPLAPLAPVSEPPALALARRVADSLRASGLLETRSYPGMRESDPDDLLLMPDDPRRVALRVLNPVLEEEPLLQTTMLPALLRAARRNLAHQIDRVRLFELAQVFWPRALGELPDEPSWLAAVLTRGERSSLWEPRAREPIFFEARGIVERVLGDLGRSAHFSPGSAQPYLHPGAAGELRVGKALAGWVGELHPEVASAFELDVPCAVFELDLGALLEQRERTARFREVSPYPAVRRDIAVAIDQEQPAGDLLDAIRKTAGDHLVALSLFDRYEGEEITEGRVSVAFRLVFQRPDRTLTDAEVAKLVDRVIKMLMNRFHAEQR